MPAPANDVTLWAQGVEVYTDPGQPWDTFPNKVRTPAGLASMGFKPSQRVAAPILNYELGVHALHLAHLRGIEAQNWAVPIDTSNSLDTPIGNQTIVFNTFDLQYYTCARSGVVGINGNSANGTDWRFGFDTTGSLAHDLGSIEFSPADGSMVMATNPAASTADYHWWDPVVKIWSATIAIANSKAVKCAKWHPETGGQFLLGGRDDNNHPVIWRILQDNSTINALGAVSGALPNAGAYFGEVTHIATGRTAAGLRVTLALASTAVVPKAYHLYYIEDDPLGIWTDLGTLASLGIDAGFTKYPQALQWDDVRKCFVLALEKGGVYISLDGQSWINQIPNTDDGSRLIRMNCFAVLGGLYVAVVGAHSTFGGAQRVMWSSDAGKTWRFVVYPLGVDFLAHDLVTCDDRIAIRAECISPQNMWLSWSLRLS